MTKRKINLKIILRKNRLKAMMKQIKAVNQTFRENHKKKKLRTKLRQKIKTKTNINKLPSPKTFMI
jgi:ABC-type hemin transport system substrate-binding protein